MALAYDANRVTRDVDATFVPHGIVIGIDTPDAALELCERFFPDEQLPPRSMAMLEDLFAAP